MNPMWRPLPTRGRLTRVVFFLPDIQGHRTGGNVYNLNLLRNLPGVARVVSAGPVSYEGLPGSLALIDSLLFGKVTALSMRRVLLVHYLDLLADMDCESALREREGLSEYDGFVVTSDFSKRRLEESGVESRRIRVVPPGLPELCRERPLPGRRRVGTLRLLSVGGLVPGKGLDSLSEVLAGLSDCDWTWRIAGSDRLDAGFAKGFLKRTAGGVLADRFEFLGELEEDGLLDAYDESDILVHASVFESCGMVLREAASRGLPSVAYRTGGVAENFPESCGELLVTPGDREGFARVLRRLLSDEGFRADSARELHDFSRGFPGERESAEGFARALEGLA